MGVCIWTMWERQDSTKAIDFILNLQLTRSLQGQILSPTRLGPAQAHHSQEQMPVLAAPLPKGHSHFLTQVIHVHCRKMPHHSLLDTSTSSVLSSTVACGQGLRPQARMQWEPGPTTTLLGPAPPRCLGLLAQVYSNSCSQ